MGPDTTSQAADVACPNCGETDQIAELSYVETKHRVKLRRDDDGNIDIEHADVAPQTLWDTDRPFGFWCNNCDHQFTKTDVMVALEESPR